MGERIPLLRHARCVYPVRINSVMPDYEPDSQPWRPEADLSVLEAIAASLNRAFGRSVCARTEEGQLIVQYGHVTAWIGADGRLTGAASIPPCSE